MVAYSCAAGLIRSCWDLIGVLRNAAPGQLCLSQSVSLMRLRLRRPGKAQMSHYEDLCRERAVQAAVMGQSDVRTTGWPPTAAAHRATPTTYRAQAADRTRPHWPSGRGASWACWARQCGEWWTSAEDEWCFGWVRAGARASRQAASALALLLLDRCRWCSVMAPLLRPDLRCPRALSTLQH